MGHWIFLMKFKIPVVHHHSLGPGEEESRVDMGVINHEVMLRVDSLGLAALTQVIVWTHSTLVPFNFQSL